MVTKIWAARAIECLRESLEPVPHELNELDWKLGLSAQKDRLTQHLIAFANYPNGGFLAYGIRDTDGVVEGIDKQRIDAALNTLANLGRDAIEPPVALDHAVIEYSGQAVLLIYVPEQNNKPVHKRGRPIDETWLRSGGTTRAASRQEVGGLMLNSTAPRWEELRASPLLELEAIMGRLDLAAIASLLKTPLPETQDETARWLVDESMIVPDGRGYFVTNFGAISAARQLEDFDALKRKRIRVIRYRGLNKVETIDELPGQKGYAIGFEGLISYLKRVLPHSEVIQQSLRTEVSVYPEIALRELIANALIHQDFTITGAGPMIEIFEDRIEFTNPGSLLPGKRTDRLIGTTPESRNELLASSFRRFRICEERGTGFQKVVAAAELFGLPPVQFSPQDNAFRVTLFAPRKFSEMSQSERIEACYQHAVLQYLSSQTLTNTTLRERFKLHEKQRNQITNLISDSVEAGRIKRKDSGSGKKFAEYIPYWV